MGNSILKKSRFLLRTLLIIVLFFSVKVSALDVKLKDIKVKESNFTITNPTVVDNVVTDTITFGSTGDYVIFEVTLNNTDNEKYTVKFIEDNNKNKNLEFTYQYSKEMKANSEYKFEMKIKYKKTLENVEKIDINDFKVILNLIREDGSEKKIIIDNPKTGDNILKYLFLLIIAIAGVILVQKKKKVGNLFLVLPILLLPLIIFASDNYKKEIFFKQITVKGVMLPYQITINVPDSEPIVKTITYGDPIGELPEVSKEGYDFEGWKDQDGNPVTEDTPVKGDLEISPVLKPITYTITYDLDGGTASNKTSYTIETDTFTLNNPTKAHYNFSGWTGSNGDVLQTTVTISQGSTGNKNYIAHYSQVDNIPYTVIHRKQKITLDGYDIADTDNERGTAGTTVRPETKTYEGFNSPEERDLLITDDGQASLTYDYTRKTIHVVINIDGSDPIERDIIYEAPIGELPDQSKDGYTFDGYEDGDHNPVTPDTPITGEITITPKFTPISYRITYDLKGGTIDDDNPNSYTIEDSIRLNNPSKAGYTFIGWTGSNGNTPSTNVVIENTTGDKSYTSNYSKSINDLNINIDADNITYDGTAKEPNIVIKDGDKTLTPGTDYTVTYTNNTNAGTATVTVTMTGTIDPETGITYDGEKELTFTINKATPTAVLNPKTEEYSGSTISFSPSDVTVTPDIGSNITFKYYTDSECSDEIDEIIDAGTYYAKAFVEGTDNYNSVETNPVTITVERKGIEEPTVTSSFTYNGLEQTLMSDTDTYTVSNNISKNAGTVNVTVTPKDNYKWSDGTTTPKTVQVTIDPYDISVSGHSSVVPIDNYTYDGNAKEPTPSVTVPLPTTIVTTILTSEDIDYSYENNTNAGTGTVIITGKGNYTGTISENFTIDKANGYINLTRNADNIVYGTSSISVDVTSNSGNISATTTNPTAQINISGNTITVSNLETISSGTTVTVKVKALESANYNEAEVEYKITVSDAAITGGSVSITGNNGVGNKLTAVVEDTTPAGTYTYQWYTNDSDSTSGGTAITGATNNEYTLTSNEVGKYIYVVVTASKENYTPITFSDKVDAEHNGAAIVTNLIEKPSTNDYCKTITYNGDSQVLTNEAGAGFAFINNSGTNAGDYNIEARLDSNYTWSDYTTTNSSITCSIGKKDITVKADNQEKTYDGMALNADNTCTDINSSLVTGHSLNCSSAGTITNAGSTTKTLDTVQINYGSDDLTSNYNITKQNGTLTIAQRNTTCTSSSNSKVYDGTPLTDNTGTCTNLVNGHVATFTNSGSVTNVSDSGTGNNTIDSVVITDNNVDVSNNYNVTTVAGDLTITKANSVCQITNDPVIYYPGDKVASITYTCTGDGNLSVTSSTNVITISDQTNTSATLTSTTTGTSVITVEKEAGANYNGTSVTKEMTVNASIYHVIFNKNDADATGTMNPQDITYGVPTNLTPNAYVKNDYTFVGWNTQSDGQGTPYLDKVEVTSLAESGNVNLYAQWVLASATFDTGQNVNAKMKKLAGSSSATYQTENTNILHFEKASNKPDISLFTSNNVVSTSTSISPIYMWFSNNTIYWWSDDSTPEFNSDNSYFFYNFNYLENIDLSSFDSSNVINMRSMFGGCNHLESLDLSSLNTSNVTNMSWLFSDCDNLAELDLSSLDVSKVTNMSYMFSNADRLTNINFGDNFDTSNVTDMSGMFALCQFIKTLDLGEKFNTSKVTNMFSMFSGMYGIKTIYAPDSFDTTNVTNSDGMFSIDFLLVGGAGTTYSASHNDKEYARIDEGSSNPGYFTGRPGSYYTVTAYGNEGSIDKTSGWIGTGNSATKGVELNTSIGTLPDASRTGYILAGWNSKADGTGTNITTSTTIIAPKAIYAQWIKAEAMFDTGYNVNVKMNTLSGGLSNITSVARSSTKPDVSQMTSNNIVSVSNSTYNAPIYMWYDNGVINWWTEDTDPDLNTSANRMFESLSNATSIDLTGIKSDLATNMANMFNGCSSLASIDLSNFETPLATDMTAMFLNCSSLTTLDISSFGGGNLTTMSRMFLGCTNLETLNMSNLDMRNVTSIVSSTSTIFDNDNKLTTIIANNTKHNNVSYKVYYYAKKLESLSLRNSSMGTSTTMDYMFGGLSSLETIDFTNFDTSSVTNMESAFNGCSSLTTLDLSSFDTSNVTSMYRTFEGCTSLTSINLDDWVTTKVTTTKNMFYNCSSLASIDLSDIHLPLVNNVEDMFYNCSSLTSLDISSFGGGNITTMNRMFLGCTNLETLNISNLDMSKVTDITGGGYSYIFDSDDKLTTIIADNTVHSGVSYRLYFYAKKLESLSLRNASMGTSTSMSNMFSGLNRLETIDFTNFYTTGVSDMQSAFISCSSLTSLDLSSFDTSDVTSMYRTFEGCTSLTSINLDNWVTTKVTNTRNMFYNCSSLASIDLSDIYLPLVNTTEDMFFGCTSLSSLDISSFVGGNVTNINGMFSNCTNLATLNMSNFDMSKVITINSTNRSIFENSLNLKTIIADNTVHGGVSYKIYYFDRKLESLSLKNASMGTGTSMSNMFSGLTRLASIDLTNFDTSNVTNMEAVFWSCSSLTTLDLSSFDTSQVTAMNRMFDSCTNLTTIITSSSFDVTSVTNSTRMFTDDTKLVGGLGTVYNSSKTDKEYAHFDGGTSDPGYFTAATGWRFVNSETSQTLTDQEWSYYVDGTRVESGWHWYPDLYNTLQKYYFVDGIAHLGWLEYEGDYYYLSTDDDDGNGYVNAGAYRSTVKEINGKNYRFDSEGRCLNYDGPNIYYIEFEGNGGTPSEASRYVDAGDEIGTLPTATRTNYVFKGWWTDLTTGTEINAHTVPTSSTTYIAKWEEIKTVTFNGNNGEFSPNVTTNIIKYADNSYQDNTSYAEPTRTGYLFVGWNTQSDGQGTSYADEQAVLADISNLNNQTIYAEWVEAKAMFDTGQNVNVKMKRLAGNSSPSTNTQDTNITSVVKSNTKPDTSSFTSDNTISVNTNVTYNAPIYAWFDNGTIYWYSEDADPELNVNASAMFENLTSTTGIDLTNVISDNTMYFGDLFYNCSSLTTLDLSSLNVENATSLYRVFCNCTSLETLNISNWDMSSVTDADYILYNTPSIENIIAENTSYSGRTSTIYKGNTTLVTIDLKNSDAGSATALIEMLKDCTNLESADLSGFDFKNVTSINGIFNGATKLTTINLDNVDTTNVTNMANMFYNCSSLETVDLSDLDGDSVTNLGGMFQKCSSLTSVNLTGFVTTNVTNMNYMFSECSSLTSLDLSSFDTGNVTEMYAMLQYTTSLTTLNISNWDMSSVTDMGTFLYGNSVISTIIADNTKYSNASYRIYNNKTSLVSVSMKNSDAGSSPTLASMFQNCTNLESVDMRNFDFKNATSANSFFAGDSKLTSINLTGVDLSDVTNIGSMFYDCTLLETVDLSSFDTTNVTEMQALFQNCSSLTSINLSNFVTTNLTNMSYMFVNCTSLTSLDLSSFDTSNVTNYYSLFAGDTGLKNLNISNWTLTSSITDFGGVFDYCNALENVTADNLTVYGYYYAIFNGKGIKTLSLKNITFVNITNISNMFGNMTNLETLDITGFDLTGITNISGLFNNCRKLQSIDLSGFDTSSVTTMNSMFNNCYELTELDLSSFDTRNVTDFNYMFCNCTNLVRIYATSLFDTSQITNPYDEAYSMFAGDTKIVGGLGTTYNASYVWNQYAHLDGGTSNPGYFTAGTGWRFVNYNTSQSLLDQEWSYYENGVRIESGWHMLDDLYGQQQKYYFVDGICHLGWLHYGDYYYYLATDDDDQNGYVNAGAYRNQSRVIGNKSYAFDSEGRCLNYDGPDIYTIRFNGNGGTPSETYKNLNTDEALGTLPTVTRDGYAFNGWWTSISGGTEVNASVVPNAGVTYYAHWIKINTVTFNSNNGEFSPNVTTNNIIYTNTYIENTSYIEPTRSGHLFAGWNTQSDGQGTAYVDEQAVLSNINDLNNQTLYASWIEAQATFDTGQNVNTKMKKLAGTSITNMAYYDSSDTNITSIQKSSTKPDISTMTTNNIVSTVINPTSSTSNTPIYMWYDNGTIYWWSEDENPRLNSDSNRLFKGLESLTNLDLSTFDTSNVTDMGSMFNYCKKISNLDLSTFDTSNVTDMSYMFSGCNNLISLDLGDNFDTSNTTTMRSLFHDCSSLTSLDLGDKFDTSKVTNMTYMFSGCSELTSLDLRDKFDTSNVIEMVQMFSYSGIITLDLGDNFDTGNVTTMGNMFYCCRNLINLNLGNKFDTRKVTNMITMFSGCSSLTVLDLGDKFNTSNVTDMRYMFYDCTNLTTIYATNSFMTTNTTSSSSMFSNDTNLVGGSGTVFDSNYVDATYAHIDGGTSNPGYFTEKTSISIVFDSNGGTGTMNSQNVQYNVETTLNTNTFTRTGYLFNGWNTKIDGTGISYSDGGNITVTSYTKLYAQWREIVATFDTGQNVNAKMKRLAGNTSATYSTSDTNITSIQKSTTQPDISTMTSNNIVSTSNSMVPIYMWYENGIIYWWCENNNTYLNEDSSYMFYYLQNLTGLDVSSFNTSNVINMKNMFGVCDSLDSLDLSSFNTNNVINMSLMFNQDTNLLSVDLSSFNTTNVTDMSGMFQICSSLTNLNISNFDTRNVIYINHMFTGCSSLTNLDLGNNFDTSSATNMKYMFNQCSSLSNLDLGDKFDTSNVTDMKFMFSNCSSLSNLDLGDKFDTSNVTDMSYMFGYCRNLVTLDLGDKFDTSNVTDMSVMFTVCSKLTTIFSSNDFVTTSLTNSNSMFYGSFKIVGGAGTTWSSSNPIDVTYAHIDGGTSNPGYFTARPTTGANISKFINYFKSNNIVKNRIVLIVSVSILTIIGLIIIVIRYKQRKKIK